MTQSDWVRLSLHIAAILAFALFMGQLFRRLRMPAVVGEILGGVILGPTLLGRISPDIFQYLFPMEGPIASARGAMMRVGMLFFIVTLGLDISVKEFRRLRKQALGVGIVGTLTPLGIGIAMTYGFPDVIGVTRENQLPVAVFLGSILSLSANPVIARILMDMGLFKEEIGKLIMSATIVDDIVGWGLFAVLLSGYGPNAKTSGGGMMVLLLMFGYIVATLLLGRYVLPHIFRYVNAHFPKPAGLIGAITVCMLLSAAATEAMGIHSFLGAFMLGIALADQYEEFKDALDTMGAFGLAFFTPVFFLTMAIAADFIDGFNLPMVALITCVAFFGKILGVFIGGKLVGMTSRYAFAIGCGLNARGILGILMASVAFDNKIIGLELFVACVVMCLLTSLFAGPALQWTLGGRYQQPDQEPYPHIRDV